MTSLANLYLIFILQFTTLANYSYEITKIVLWLGVTATKGTALKGHSIRMGENHGPNSCPVSSASKYFHSQTLTPSVPFPYSLFTQRRNDLYLEFCQSYALSTYEVYPPLQPPAFSIHWLQSSQIDFSKIKLFSHQHAAVNLS